MNEQLATLEEIIGNHLFCTGNCSECWNNWECDSAFDYDGSEFQNEECPQDDQDVALF